MPRQSLHRPARTASLIWAASLIATAAGIASTPSPVQAQALVSDARLSMLTALRPAGDDVTTPDGTVGWPGARYPTSPPLYAVRPGTTRGWLFGGFMGGGPLVDRTTQYTAFGLYNMSASVSVYDRLAYDPADGLFGRALNTPVRARDGALYVVMSSPYGEEYAGTSQPADIAYSPAVGLGQLIRTDADGTHPAVMIAAQGQLRSPNGALVIDAQDNLYGIDKGPQGHGRIFKLSLSAGTFTTVHEFTAGPNGMKHVANDLVLGSDGLLYGVTGYYRGLSGHPGTPTATNTPTGTLYRIDPNTPSSFTVLHNFTLADGEINVEDNATAESWRMYPSGVLYAAGMSGDATVRSLLAGQQKSLSSLIDGGDGYLYGTTSAAECYVHVNHTSQASALRRIERDSPLCGYMHWAANANFQYVTPYPYHDGPRPYGAIYRLPKAGGVLQIVHTFSETDGATPRGPLAMGADGAIYGTTLGGGPNLCDTGSTVRHGVRCGTLYRFKPTAITTDVQGQVTASGFEQVHAFSGNDGRVPLGLRAASDGRLYGVTSMGGSYGNSGTNSVPTDFGTVFQVSVSSSSTPEATASLVANAAQIAAGEPAVLTWITSNASNCTASSSAGDWVGSVASFGSVTLTPSAGTYRYTLTCDVTGATSGAQVSSYTTVFVSTNATAEDGNTVSYGNGGGGAASPLLLLPMALGAWWLRRRRSVPPASHVSHASQAR
ncbi:MAG: choice-of-anchor tandem repeat GloVer-containing protein [Pseudomonadota bacterium]